MTSYLVTRHNHTKKWLANNGVSFDVHVTHIDIAFMKNLKAGDTVIGIAPLHLIAQMNEKGVKYWHFSMVLPIAMRGKELTTEEINACQAEIVPYKVQRLKE